MNTRFARALTSVGGADPKSDLFAELVRRYGEPHRRYHTLDHVAACLAHLDACGAQPMHLAEVELALFFHDVIYEPGRPDNERASADFARAKLGEAGISAAIARRVAEHVLATEHHQAASSDGALVVDIDLSILGADPSTYDRFERQIRAEYASVPDDAYRLGRARVLEKFLARPRIYSTHALYERFEQAAKQNLERALLALDHVGGEK